jgi:hypothetical protein
MHGDFGSQSFLFTSTMFWNKKLKIPKVDDYRAAFLAAAFSLSRLANNL